MCSYAWIFRWKLNIVIAFLRNLYLSKYLNIEHPEGKNIPLYAHVYTYYSGRSGFWDVLFRELDIQVYDLVPGMPFFPLYAWWTSTIPPLWIISVQCISQFSRSVMSNSLRPHELQHARPPCPSPTPGVHPDSRPSSQWCHPATSSSVAPSPPAPNPSQHQSLFQWVNSSHEEAKVLEFQL